MEVRQDRLVVQESIEQLEDMIDPRDSASHGSGGSWMSVFEVDRAKEAAKKAGLLAKILEERNQKLSSKKRKGERKWNSKKGKGGNKWNLGIAYRGKG